MANFAPYASIFLLFDLEFRIIWLIFAEKTDMATLKIYNDIQTESEKMEAKFWGDAEGVCYKDIDAFCDSIAADDDKIDIKLHCDGGSVLEGWAIYDRLRATGKTISATVEGNAASMATIIMMAAPKERRYAYESAQICVHNPWLCPWQLGNSANADDLQKYADDLRAEQQKMVDLYVDRCGCTADDIQALMDEDKYIGAEEAKNYGLIGSIIPPASASKKSHSKGARHGEQHKNNNTNTKKMDKKDKKDENVEVKQSFIDKVLKFFGKSSIAEITFGMDLNTADGQTLTVQREEGAPQVGDQASPDGEFVMPDGSTIVVADGVITEIRPANDEENTDDPQPTDDKDKKIADLEAQIADKDEQISKLQEQLDAALKNARSKDDLRILNAVKMAGGEKVLAKISSSYTPERRQPTGKQAEQKQPETRAEKAKAIKENLKKLRNKK